MRTQEDAYRQYHTPLCSVEDLGDAYMVEVEVPGTPPDDIDIDLGAASILLSTEARAQRAEGAARRYYGTVELPEEIDADQATVSYDFGLLTLRLPKVRLTKRRSMRVTAAGA